MSACHGGISRLCGCEVRHEHLSDGTREQEAGGRPVVVTVDGCARRDEGIEKRRNDPRSAGVVPEHPERPQRSTPASRRSSAGPGCKRAADASPYARLATGRTVSPPAATLCRMGPIKQSKTRHGPPTSPSAADSAGPAASPARPAAAALFASSSSARGSRPSAPAPAPGKFLAALLCRTVRDARQFSAHKLKNAENSGNISSSLLAGSSWTLSITSSGTRRYLMLLPLIAKLHV